MQRNFLFTLHLYQGIIQQLYIVHSITKHFVLQYNNSTNFLLYNVLYNNIWRFLVKKRSLVLSFGLCYNVFMQKQRGDILKSWMGKLADNLEISEINLPGTHNSCTKKVQFSYFSKCHDLTVYEQLNIGIRFLDIRVEKAGNKLKTVHSIADCYAPHGKREKLFLEYVLEDCQRFLRENPTEAVILCIKRDDGASSEETFDLLYECYIKNNPLWFTENRVPLLGEVRGKMVFFNRCHVDFSNGEYSDNNTGLRLSNWPDLPRNAENFLAKAPICTVPPKSEEFYLLQDMYKLFPREKWYKAVLPLIENPPQEKGLFLNYFTAASPIHSPRKYTKIIHKKFEKITLKSLKKYGWLIFDFPTKNMCEKVISTNFDH